MSRQISMQDSLFKDLYVDIEDHSLLNKKAPASSILMKNKDVEWVGDSYIAPVQFGAALGLGFRSSGENLPTPVAARRGQAVLAAKSVYSTAEYERQAILASRTSKGAFAKATAKGTKDAVDGFDLYMIERSLFGDGSGKLGEVGTVDSGVGTAASPWVITMATSGTNGPKYIRHYFPVGAKLDVYSTAGVLQLTGEVVARSATTISLKALSISGDSAPAATDIFYWEGNKDKEFMGLLGIAPTTAGTLYGIDQTANPEYRGVVSNLAGATIAYSDINDIIADMEDELGDSPNIGFVSHRTLARLKSQSESKKEYIQEKSSNAKIGFSGLQVESANGPFALVASQMCPANEIFFANKDYLTYVLRQDFGWFDDDGSILMRDPNKDIYGARYGGYGDLFCSKPNSVGRVRNFLV